MPDRLVVKNGSNTLSTCSGGIGAPLFLIKNLNFQMSACPLVAHRDGQDAARSHGFDRILENAEEDLLHLRFVGAHRGEDSGIFFDYLDAGGFQFGRYHGQRIFETISGTRQSRRMRSSGLAKSRISLRIASIRIRSRIVDTGLRVEVEDALAVTSSNCAPNRTRRGSRISGLRGRR